MVGAAAEQRGQKSEPYIVKNTFIEVDTAFFEDDSIENGFDFPGKRQVSEPAFVTGRQVSSHPVTYLGTLQESVSELPQMEPDSPVKSNPRSTAAGVPTVDWSTDTPPRQSSGSICDELEIEIEPSPTAAEAVAAAARAADATWRAAVGSLSATAASGPPTVQQAHCDSEQELAPFVPLAGAELKTALARSHNATTNNLQQLDMPSDWHGVLTVMMRNLPNRYTQQMLLEEVGASGFDGEFDFLYLPIDPETSANKGYAFLNFVTSEAAWRFKCAFEGTRMARFNSSKYVSVNPAALQGLEANYIHYSSARCSRGHPSVRPLFLREPENISGLGRGRGSNSRRGGQRRRNNAKSMVDVAAARQNETTQLQPQTQLPQQQAQQWTPASCSWAPPSQAPVFQQQVMTKFCPHCGGSLLVSHRFCQYCGEAQ
mmetsp:Transcript_127031/g.365388  ORF Transcript_127031/g.365388 Transcript_127031/m.365388 type:complete len:429 (+) Transcript_127031:99-1385(+)